MTAPARKTPVRRKPDPKPSIGATAAEAVAMPGTIEYLGFDWDPIATPIGHAVALELGTWVVPAAAATSEVS